MKIRTRYIFAFSLIALCVTMLSVMATNKIKKMQEDAMIINLSGKQRGLSQVIASDAIRFYYENSNQFNKELQSSIKKFKQNNELLLNLTKKLNIQNSFYQENSHLQNLAHRYIQEATLLSESGEIVNVYFIKNNSKKIYGYLNEATEVFKEISREKVDKLEEFEYTVLFIVYALLALEVFFIFFPYEKTLQTTQKKLHSELDKFKALSENVIYLETDTKGVVTYASRLLEKTSGFSRNEITGRKYAYLKHRDLPKDIHRDMVTTLSRGEKWKGVFQNRKKERGFYWVDAVAEPVLDTNSTIVGYRSIMYDITDKKEIEQKNIIIEKQARHAAMGEMISMIAHQWKQPLNSLAMVNFSIQYVNEYEHLDNKELTTASKKIDELIAYMSKTIEDFRNFLKPSSSKEKIKLLDLIEHPRELISPQLQNYGVIVESDYDGLEDKNLKIDSRKFDQVMLNLYKNSLDEFGEKKIRKPKIKLKVYKEDKKIVLIYSDNAGGIPKHAMEKLFDPYFSTKNQNGTGLGLYMTKMIIEDHLHGRISAANNDEGAVFEIVIPYKKKS